MTKPAGEFRAVDETLRRRLVEGFASDARADWRDVRRRARRQGVRREPRRLAATPVAAGLVAAAAVALVAARPWSHSSSPAPPVADSPAQTQRPQPHGGTAVKAHAPSPTKATQLVAFRYRLNGVSSADLPASVAELVTNMGADAASAQEPILGPPAVYLFRRGSNNLCVVIALTHASGSCFSVLAAAGGSISSPGLSIVDGQEFITGLAANNVTTISATVKNTPQTPGTTAAVTIKNNVFLASIPYNGGAVAAVTLNVSRTNESPLTLTIPGVPAPIAHTSPTP